MGTQFWLMLIKIIIFLPFILFLVYLSLKYGGSKLQDMQNGKYIKILERIPINKENNLLTVKIGEKGFVLSSTNGKIEILMEIKDEDLKKIEASNKIPEYKNLKEMYEKLFKKEDRYEQKI